VVYDLHRVSRTEPGWHALSKIGLVMGDNRITIEGMNGTCPVLGQNCAPVTVDTQNFPSQSIPLEFENVTDPVTLEQCGHLRIRNTETGTTIECHQWFQGYLSCHLTFRTGEAVTGVLFDRGYGDLDTELAHSRALTKTESLFFENRGETPCELSNQVSALELELSTVSITSTTLAASDQEALMTQVISSVSSSLVVEDADTLVTERQSSIDAVLAGSAFVSGPRTQNCGDRLAQATQNCTALATTALSSVCIKTCACLRALLFQ